MSNQAGTGDVYTPTFLIVNPDGTLAFLFEGSIVIPASIVPSLDAANMVRWVVPEGTDPPIDGEDVGSVGVLIDAGVPEASGQFRVVNPYDPTDFALLELEVTLGGSALRVRADEGIDSAIMQITDERAASNFLQVGEGSGDAKISRTLRANLIWPGGVTNIVANVPHGLPITPSAGLVSSNSQTGVGAHSTELDGFTAANAVVRVWTIGGFAPLAGAVTPVTILVIE